MKVVIHHTNIAWQRRYLDYFITGFKKHGIIAEPTRSEHKVESDVAVLFGPNYWKNIERTHDNYLLVNRKFIGDVNDNVTIGWDGLNGRARFCVDEVNPRRLLRHSFAIEPWREYDVGGTLLLGQYDLGRCGRYATLEEWYRFVRENTGAAVRFRKWPGVRPLIQDCKNIKMAVTLNSTVGIETILLGVPTVACDEGSPAWPVCAHHIGHVRRADNRLQWLEYLANCQYHFREIQNGDFWRQLNPKRGPRLCDVKL